MILAFVHWLAPRGLLHALTAAVLGYAVSALPWTWLPAPPLLETDAYAWPDPPTYAPDTEDAAESPIEDFDAEDVMYRQPALLDAAIARLVPQRPGIVDLYAITFAGDGAERVFRNEAEYAATLFAQRFDAEGRTLVLANSADSLDATPLATWTALHRALQAMAGIMDPDEDVLLLYLTTHGSEEHELLVALDPLPLNQILPVDVADALRTSPSIRWKVLIVNACYSGGFVDALHDDSTMVITSARPDRTSFGCGVESDITYFGQAFLVEALNRTTSLPDAFRHLGQLREIAQALEQLQMDQHRQLGGGLRGDAPHEGKFGLGRRVDLLQLLGGGIGFQSRIGGLLNSGHRIPGAQVNPSGGRRRRSGTLPGNIGGYRPCDAGHPARWPGLHPDPGLGRAPR